LKPENNISEEAHCTGYDGLTCALPVQLVANPVLWPIRLRLHPGRGVLEADGCTRVRVSRLAKVDMCVTANILANHVALISSQL
jgi:hypothetical protein